MRYWVYLNGEVPGSFAPQELGDLPGFSQTTLVCPSDGEIQEKNWRRAGEFPELAASFERRAAAQPPTAPLASPSASDISALLDNTGARLISHVSELMKQVEAAREQQSLISALQRQVAALTMDLKLARDKAQTLEEKGRRCDELEASARRDGERLRDLQAAELRHSQDLADLRAEVERLTASCEAARQDGRRAEEERSEQRRLADKLARELAEREGSLAKAVAVVKRLEETLLPSLPSELPPTPPLEPEPASPVPLAEPAQPPELQVPSLPAFALSSDAPAAEPAPQVAAEAPAAHKALIRAVKRLFAKDLHS